MNPTRVVAGVAALAVGFGITLAAVDVAPDDTIESVDVTTTVAGDATTLDCRWR